MSSISGSRCGVAVIVPDFGAKGLEFETSWYSKSKNFGKNDKKLCEKMQKTRIDQVLFSSLNFDFLDLNDFGYYDSSKLCLFITL